MTLVYEDGFIFCGFMPLKFCRFFCISPTTERADSGNAYRGVWAENPLFFQGKKLLPDVGIFRKISRIRKQPGFDVLFLLCLCVCVCVFFSLCVFFCARARNFLGPDRALNTKKIVPTLTCFFFFLDFLKRGENAKKSKKFKFPPLHPITHELRRARDTPSYTPPCVNSILSPHNRKHTTPLLNLLHTHTIPPHIIHTPSTSSSSLSGPRRKDHSFI